jgi:hypothetical protein
MVKLMLEQHGIAYLPVESVSMQERVRAVEFVLGRCGLALPAARTPGRSPAPAPARSAARIGPEVPATAAPIGPTGPTAEVLRAGVESWPYALVDHGDHEA